MKMNGNRFQLATYAYLHISTANGIFTFVVVVVLFVVVYTEVSYSELAVSFPLRCVYILVLSQLHVSIILILLWYK